MMDLTTKAAGMARAFAIGAAGLGLAGCSEFPSLNLVNDSAKAAQGQTQTETTLIERDVEAPEVFSVTESGLWDGRPSLGGVWVAHPDVGEPERVILGIVGGLAFLGASQYWLGKYPVYAQALAGGGIGILYLSIFSAFVFTGART